MPCRRNEFLHSSSIMPFFFQVMEDYVLVNNFSAVLLWRATTLLVGRDVSQEELVMGKHAL